MFIKFQVYCIFSQVYNSKQHEKGLAVGNYEDRFYRDAAQIIFVASRGCCLQVPYNTVGCSLDDNLYIPRNRSLIVAAAYH